MLGEFLARLAVALPLVCALAVLSLLAAKRGWLPLPGLTLPGLALPGFRTARAPATAPVLDLVAVKALTPAARLAIVRFAGREHLLAVSGQSLLLVASAPEAAPIGAPTTLPPQEPETWTS
jgi:hypothetical protein